MSEQLQEKDGFTTEGFAPFPSTYYDDKFIRECSEWDDSRIERMVTEYWQFLERDDIQPRARATAERILEHLGFEMDFRYGAYDYSLNRIEDEVCDES